MKVMIKEILSLKRQKDGRNPKVKCWACGTHGHVRRNCHTRLYAEMEKHSKITGGQLIHGHIAGQRLPEVKKSYLKLFQITSMSGGDNGRFVMGHINKLRRRLIIDTEANVAIVRKDVARELGEKFISTTPTVPLRE